MKNGAFFTKAIALFLLTGLPVFGTQAHAQNTMLMVGGNCDSEDSKKNKFIEEFSDYSKQFKKMGWDTRFLFAQENQPNLRKAFEKKTLDKVKSFNKKNLILELEKIEKSNPLPKQLFVHFSVHGDLDSKTGMSSFCVGREDWIFANDPDLLKALERIKNKGVKLAFNSNACFSGKSVDGFGKLGCAMSVSPYNQVGYFDTKSRLSFLNLLKNSETPVSMSHYFLNLSASRRNLPMISTQKSAFNENSEIIGNTIEQTFIDFQDVPTKKEKQVLNLLLIQFEDLIKNLEKNPPHVTGLECLSLSNFYYARQKNVGEKVLDKDICDPNSLIKKLKAQYNELKTYPTLLSQARLEYLRENKGVHYEFIKFSDAYTADEKKFFGNYLNYLKTTKKLKNLASSTSSEVMGSKTNSLGFFIRYKKGNQKSDLSQEEIKEIQKDTLEFSKNVLNSSGFFKAGTSDEVKQKEYLRLSGKLNHLYIDKMINLSRFDEGRDDKLKYLLAKKEAAEKYNPSELIFSMRETLAKIRPLQFIEANRKNPNNACDQFILSPGKKVPKSVADLGQESVDVK